MVMGLHANMCLASIGLGLYSLNRFLKFFFRNFNRKIKDSESIKLIMEYSLLVSNFLQNYLGLIKIPLRGIVKLVQSPSL